MTLNEKLAVLYSETDSNKLSVYKDMSIDAIRNYMNISDTSDIIIQKYESAILQLVGNKIKTESANGIKSYTASKTSVTYADSNRFSITEDVKALLPKPYVKVLG
jgi:hypothetical protein